MGEEGGVGGGWYVSNRSSHLSLAQGLQFLGSISCGSHGLEVQSTAKVISFSFLVFYNLLIASIWWLSKCYIFIAKQMEASFSLIPE